MKIAIKGLIGSGKSTVAKYLCRRYGAVHYNCDQRVKYHYQTNQQIIKLVNQQILQTSSDTIDISKLRAVAFGNKDKLLQLEAIIYPVIYNEIIETCRNHKYVVIDGQQIDKLDIKFDYTIYIETNNDNIIKRVKQRDNRTEQEIEKILAIQNSYKQSQVNKVLINNGQLVDLYSQVDKMMEEL